MPELVPSIEALVTEFLTLSGAGPASADDARDVAERLHARGTTEALAHLTARPDHARALALMRDARWTVAGAGDVPLFTSPGGFAAAAVLIPLRLADAGRTVASRWAGAAVAGATRRRQPAITPSICTV